MKLQDPDWEANSPGPLRSSADYTFFEMAKNTATKGREQDILEDFKWRFSKGTSKRSSGARYADSDLYLLMKKAAENAPVFVAAFADACADIKEQGIEAPSVAEINHTLRMYNCEYKITDDTVVRYYWYLRTDSEEADSEAKPIVKLTDLRSVDVSSLARIVRPDGFEAPSPEQSWDEPEASEDIDLEAIAWPSTQQPVSATSAERILRQVAWMKNVSRGAQGFEKFKVPLKAFLCHSSSDKPAVKKLYKHLKDDGREPWLDSVNLLPGEDWEAEIRKAVRESHVVIVCLSHHSVTKAGFVQKEIKFALDVADEQPESRIYIIPARLEDCKVPERLSKWHWVNLFEEDGYDKLIASLDKRAAEL